MSLAFLLTVEHLFHFIMGKITSHTMNYILCLRATAILKNIVGGATSVVLLPLKVFRTSEGSIYYLKELKVKVTVAALKQ